MNPFTYWKRGRKVVKMITKVPPGGGQYPLVYHQIVKGCFDPCPYGEVIKLEHKLFAQEIDDYIKANPRVSKQSIQAYIIKRRPVYNKRLRKLEEAYHEYECTRLPMLKKGLIDAFGVDVWEEALSQCDGSVMQLYNTYKRLANAVD